MTLTATSIEGKLQNDDNGLRITCYGCWMVWDEVRNCYVVYRWQSQERLTIEVGSATSFDAALRKLIAAGNE